MKKWETLDRRTILDQGKYLVVENHTVRLPDGRIIRDWPWIITPDYVNVLAVTEDDRFLCFRQTKYAVEGTTLAPVGGFIEPGEEPAVAARRELREETGYGASEWIDLGHYCVDGNRGAGTAYLYLAIGARPVGRPTADDLEEQELLHLNRYEIEEALEEGAFKGLSWTTLVALSLRHMKA